MYNIIVKIARLHLNNNIPYDNKVVDNLKNRMDILTGEIQSGNDNIDLLKEIRMILFKLTQIKCISKRNADNHYKQIEKLFYD